MLCARKRGAQTRNWEDDMTLTDVGVTMGGEGLGERPGFSPGHAKSEMPIGHPREEVKQAVG